MPERLVRKSEERRELDGKPLAGRTIIVTRARAQAAEFATELGRYGARVVECPTIEIVEPESYNLLDQALENLYGYDWLIFTSVNGVDYFFRRLEAKGIHVSELDELRVCAIGEATADRLRDLQVHVDVVPARSRAEGVFEALELYLGGRREFFNLNFLLPRAAVARDYLPQALEEAGARVDVVPAYRTIRPESTDRARIEAMLLGGAIDCITFNSSSAITNFAQLFDTNDLSKLLKGVAVACLGEITSKTASDYGLDAHIRPSEASISALARAIAENLPSLG